MSYCASSWTSGKEYVDLRKNAALYKENICGILINSRVHIRQRPIYIYIYIYIYSVLLQTHFTLVTVDTKTPVHKLYISLTVHLFNNSLSVNQINALFHFHFSLLRSSPLHMFQSSYRPSPGGTKLRFNIHSICHHNQFCQPIWGLNHFFKLKCKYI
jgi:hypothetical protein